MREELVISWKYAMTNPKHSLHKWGYPAITKPKFPGMKQDSFLS